MHARALSEWLKQPTLDPSPEIPHFVATILYTAKYLGKSGGLLRTGRFLAREVLYRAYSNVEPVRADVEVFIDFLRDELRDPKALSMILEGLTDINEDVRIESIRLLENLSHIPEVLEGLAASLNDPDPGVRTLAGQSIARHGSPIVVGLLGKIVRGEKPRARLEAVRTLGLLGPPAQAALEEALGSDEPEVRAEAALLLGEQGRDAGTDLIIELLRSPAHSAYHLRAINILSNIQVNLPTDVAVASLKHTDWQVRQACAKALGVAKVVESVPTLIDALKDNSSGVRHEVARALGLIGDPRARPGLTEVVEKDRDKDVRQAAKEALVQFSEVQGVIDLLRSNDRDALLQATIELGVLQSREAIPPLIEATGNGDPEIRREVARVLGKIGDSGALACLETLAKDDPNPGVRKVATLAIMFIKMKAGRSS